MQNRYKTILIIDDDVRNTFALSLVLKTKGFTSVSVNSASQGLEHLKSHPDVGIILLDIMMPDMDGFQMLEALNADQGLRAIPVIAVTAQAMQGDEQKCMAAGAVGYISKPVDIEALTLILHKFLS